MHIGVAAGRTAWARAAVQPRRPLGAQIARRIARPPRAEGAGGDRDNESRSVEEEALDVISRGVLRAYDAAARAQRESLHELEKELAAAKKTTQEMRDASVWRPLINVMEYLTTWYADRLESTKASVADTAAQRAELLRTLTADPGAAPPDFSAFPGAAGGSESALEEAFGIVITSLVLASVASWGAGLCGLQAAELLPDPSAFDPAAATAWAAWTAPYVGATAALGLAAPRLLGGDGVLRFGDVSPRFFSQLAPAGLVSVAAVVAYSQALVWQGAWLQAALRAAGAGDAAQLLADPSLAGPDLAQSLGGLVAAPRLLAPLVAPTAVAVVAAGQAGWWALRAGAKNLLATALVGGEGDFRELLGQAPPREGGPPPVVVVVKPPLGGTGDNALVNDMLADLRGQAPLSVEDLALSTGRLALTSAWLSAETLATGNMWLAMGTSAAGMLAGMAIVRAREGGGGGDGSGGDSSAAGGQ